MKAGELRGLIRKTKGNPTIILSPPPGATDRWRLSVQKTSLLEELDRIFPGGKAVETNLEFNAETGILSCPIFSEQERLAQENTERAVVEEDDDIILEDDDEFDLDDL